MIGLKTNDDQSEVQDNALHIQAKKFHLVYLLKFNNKIIFSYDYILIVPLSCLVNINSGGLEINKKVIFF